MRKKILSLILGTAMIATLLAGCGGKEAADPVDSSAQTTESGTEATGTLAEQAIAERKAKAEETGEYQKVVFAFYTWTGEPAGTKRVEEKINEYTRESLGLEVELLVQDSASYAQNVRLMLSADEQIDIYNSCPLGFTATVNDGYCYDLEQDGLIQNYGAGILDTIKQTYVDGCRVSGTLYGLPDMRDMAIAPATFLIGQEYLDYIGYDYESQYKNGEEIVYCDFSDITDIFAQLHEAYPEKDVFAPTDGLINQGSKVDLLGRDVFGVLLDPANSLKVENLFTSDVFLERCKMAYDWNQKGYISQDSLTDDTAISTRIKAGTCMALMAAGKPGYKTQAEGENGRPMILFQCEENIMKSDCITNICWHINQGTEDPIAAMQLLNAMYTDPVLSNLIIWGEENVDYVKTEDGHIRFPDGVDANNAEYYHTMNWLMPNQFIANIWEGDPLDLWDQMEQFNNEAPTSKALGFAFDNSEYAAEYAALTNIYDEYVKQLMFGFLEPEAGIAEMVERMEAAGLNEYIAAKQAALDEWAAANGVQ